MRINITCLSYTPLRTFEAVFMRIFSDKFRFAEMIETVNSHFDAQQFYWCTVWTTSSKCVLVWSRREHNPPRGSSEQRLPIGWQPVLTVSTLRNNVSSRYCTMSGLSGFRCNSAVRRPYLFLQLSSAASISPPSRQQPRCSIRLAVAPRPRQTRLVR